MDIVARVGSEDVAVVYVGKYPDGELVEFVEAISPPFPREKKWVVMLSTLYGCPVECKMCDAGGFYHGKVSKDRMLAQIDYMVDKHYPDRVIPCEQFKIQFARMGEPTFNRDVLRVLEELPSRYQAPGLMPSLSTVAPAGVDGFFEELRQIKDKYYSGGRFQFQFSLHTSDEELRKTMIPVKMWSFAQMAEFGERYYQPGDRKVTLNFALAEGNPVEPESLLRYFDPDKFLIKITPLNPTYSAERNGMQSYLDAGDQEKQYELPEKLKAAGYQVILSIGEREENLIGSNCGQFVLKHVQAESQLGDGYLYKIEHQLEG